MDEAMRLKNRMISIFNRKGRDGQWAKLFDHLDQWQKDFLLGQVPLQEEEMPVIGGVGDHEKWFLITTQRITWLLKGAKLSIPVHRVWEASMDFNSISSDRTKLEVQELEITTQDGKRYTIPIEEGSPLIGVWNVLKETGFRNRQTAATLPA